MLEAYSKRPYISGSNFISIMGSMMDPSKIHLRSLKHHFPLSRHLLRTLARTMKWGKSNLILLHQILKLLLRSDTILLLLTFHWPKQVKRPNLTLRWWGHIIFLAVLIVAQSCPTLYNPMDCSTPGFPVLHCLPEIAQTHVHRIGDATESL